MSLKIVLVLILGVASGSLGGVAYYYQTRAANLNSQVATLNNNANSLNDQIASLKGVIENLTTQISQLQSVNSQLDQTATKIQSLEAQLSTANSQLQTLQNELSTEISNLQAIESSFNTQLSSLNAQLAADQAEIAQLQAQISQLQRQLSSSLCVSGRTITIGELLDLTDGLSTQGVRAREGSVIAINDINSFLGTAGCNLKFTTQVDDYALDNSKALADLEALAAAGVQVVVGPLNSAALYNLIQFADANHIVLISPSSTSAALAIPASPTKYFFRTVPDDRWQGMADAKMIQTEGATKLVILQRHDAYGDSLANATAHDFNLLLTANTGSVDNTGCLASDTVCTIQYDASTTDFTSVLTVLNNDFNALNVTSSIDRVAIDAVSFEEFSQVVYQIQQQHPNLVDGHLPGCATGLPGCVGSGPASIWVGTDGEAQDTVISSNATSVKFFQQNRLPSTIYDFLNNTKTVHLYTAFASAFPGNVCDVYCRGAYDDVWLAALATLDVGYNGTRIQAAMLTVASNYYGVTGWNGLDSDGDRIASIYQVWKVEPAGSSFGWTFAGFWVADPTLNTGGQMFDFNPN